MTKDELINGDYPTVLALDLGITTGICVNGTNRFDIDTLTLTGKEREFSLYVALNNLFFWNKPDAVCYEFAAFQRGKARESWFCMLGVLKVACQRYGVESIPVPITTIKKHVTGNGRASKEDMIYHVNELGFDVGDDNEADAIGVMLTALERGMVVKG